MNFIFLIERTLWPHVLLYITLFLVIFKRLVIHAQKQIHTHSSSISFKQKTAIISSIDQDRKKKLTNK